jgi:hypothetical protein
LSKAIGASATTSSPMKIETRRSLHSAERIEVCKLRISLPQGVAFVAIEVLPFDMICAQSIYTFEVAVGC